MHNEQLDEKVIAKFALDEFTDHTIYKELSRREKGENNRATLGKLSEMEYFHYEFWRTLLSSNFTPRISKAQLIIIRIMRVIFGLTFTLKLFERHEKGTIRSYENILQKLEGEKRQILARIIMEEKEHENYFLSQINESILKYMSFIVLGLADAIIEITGVHAGFLGVTSSTLIAGVAGLVVGFAASISMASAAYLQAKQSLSFNPINSSVMTGISYLGAVSLLALPYFFTSNMLLAFLFSLCLAILMIGYFTIYGAVLRDESITKEFITGLSLTIGTAIGAFLFGEALGRLLGIHPYMT
jgi:VIT1/CCC1 family predicted Fe2+/Mn2+ transporter